MSKLFFLNKDPLETIYYKSFNKLNQFKSCEKETFINIVIIADGSKKKFKKCYDSIKKQSYLKTLIYIAFFDEAIFSYILEITTDSTIIFIPLYFFDKKRKFILSKNNKNYIVNLKKFNNDIKKYIVNRIVNPFKIIIINESLMLINRNCLKYINHLMLNNNILYWSTYNQNKNEMNIDYCYDFKYKNQIDDIKNKDIEKLLKNNNINITKENIVLTKSI